MTSDDKTVFVAEVLPDKNLSYHGVSTAAQNFCYRLISANVFFHVLKLAPINVCDNLKINYDDSSFIQSRFFPQKGIFRLLNSCVECIVAFFKLRASSCIWFYNISPHTIILFTLLQHFTNSKTCLILADHTPTRSIFSLQYWIGKTIWKAHAIISLSARTEYRTHARFASIPGIIIPIQKTGAHVNSQPYFLFSGLLGAVTGIELALETFARIPKAKLVITGHDGQGIVERYADRYPNIEYRGFLTKDEYELVLSDAFCCLNFRNPNLEENQNNFPSKMLEYLNHGKLVISTMKYPELGDIPYMYAQYSVISCTNAIHEALEIYNSGKLSDFYRPEKVQELCSPARWREAIQRLSL